MKRIIIPLGLFIWFFIISIFAALFTITATIIRVLWNLKFPKRKEYEDLFLIDRDRTNLGIGYGLTKESANKRDFHSLWHLYFYYLKNMK